jgi:type II secretory pathway predicted ATPase ExeA
MTKMIQYRCQVAGRIEPLFTQDALTQIFHLTHGNPGQTIRLCGFALDETVGNRKQICGIEEIQTVWERWIFLLHSI